MADNLRLIICTFDATDRANEVKEIIERLDAQTDTIRLGNIAIVQRRADGQISFREAHDIRNELSEIAGIVAGGVAWLAYAITGAFGPPASQMAGLEAENIVAARLGDHGFPDDALYQIGQRLDSGESALIVLARPVEEPHITTEIEQLGGKIVTHEVGPELAAALASGG